MTIDTLLLCGSTLAGALIGFVGSDVKSWVKTQRTKDGQLFKLLYVKVYRLRDKSPDDGSVVKPIRSLVVDRIKDAEKTNVFDEVNFFRLNIFRTERNFTTEDRGSATIDLLQVLHPDGGTVDAPSRAERDNLNFIAGHIKERSNVFFTRTPLYNAFQRKNEYFELKAEADILEAVMIVDLSALTDCDDIISGFSAYIDQNSTPIGVSKLKDALGMYKISHKNLLKDQVMHVDFVVKWDKVNELYKAGLL